jgi:hypothetical protein
MQIIEPCFSDMTYCKGMDRFSLRSTIKVNIQIIWDIEGKGRGKIMPPEETRSDIRFVLGTSTKKIVPGRHFEVWVD